MQVWNMMLVIDGRMEGWMDGWMEWWWSYLITWLQVNDGGSYVCTAVNTAGRDSTEILLRVQGAYWLINPWEIDCQFSNTVFAIC